MTIFNKFFLFILIILLLLLEVSQNGISAKGYNYEDNCENNICQSLQINKNDTLRYRKRERKISTESLTFKRCEIPVINAKLFRDFTNLRELDLRDSKIELYTNRSFQNLTDLQILFLSRNFLTKLPENGFSKNINLQFLWLDYNYIEKLESGSFKNLSALQYLSLEGNQINELPDGVFEDLISLYGLYIQNNNLEILDDDLFANCDKLNSLHMHNNNLKKISSNIFTNKNLQYVDLSNNQIQDLSLNFYSIVTFKGENAFTSGQIQLFGAIENLDISNNNIQGINIGNLSALEKFIWSGEIQLDLNFLKEASNLKELTLNSLEITTYPTTFLSTMTELKYLNLSRCQIAYLHPNTFNYQDNLERLDLSFNNLQELNINLFLPISKLKQLNIKDNNFICSQISPNIRDFFNQNSINVESDPLPYKIKDQFDVVEGILCRNYDNEFDLIQNDENASQNDKLKSEINELRTHLKIIVQNFEIKFSRINEEIEEIKRRNDIINNVNEKFWNQISVGT